MLKCGLDEGLSFPKARGNALNATNNTVFEPNDILGVEYLKALKLLGSSVQPFATRRNDTHDHSAEFNGDRASASAIRAVLAGRGVHDAPRITRVMPHDAAQILFDEIGNGRHNFADRYSGILHYALASMSIEQLREIADMNEGLENRILAAAKSVGTFTETAKAVKTKRYTLSRIYRVLLRIILNIRQSELDYYAATGFSRYARVLGFRKASADLLGSLCDNAKIPMITNVKKAADTMDNPSRAMLEKELQATEVYNAPLYAAAIGPELSEPLVMV